MKKSKKQGNVAPRNARPLIAGIACLLAWNANAGAQLHFDINGSTAGAGTPGTATWDTGTNWTIDALGAIDTVGWVDDTDVIFSAGTDAAGTWNISIAGTVRTSSITFNSAVNTIHNISGGVIDTGELALAINASAAGTATGRSKTISSAIAGTGGIFILANGDTSTTGGGSNSLVALTGANTFSGGVTIASGVVSATSNFGAASNAITLDGGGLVATVNTTLNRDLVVGAAGGVLRSYGGVTNFTLNGNISGSGTLTRTDGGTAFFNGDLSGFSGIFRQAAGNAVIATDASMTGAIEITAGQLWVGNSGSVGSIADASSLTIGNGSLFIRRSDTVNATAILPANIMLNTGAVIEFNPTASSGVMNLDRDLGTDATVGIFRVSGGAANLVSGTDLTVNTVSLGLQSGTNRGTLNIADGSTITTRFMNLGAGSGNSGTVNQTGGTVTLLAGAEGFRLGHWTNGANPGNAYNLSGGTLDASALGGNTGEAQLVTIGWDGTATMTVGGGENTATLKAVGIQMDRNRTNAGFSASSLVVAENGIVEIGAQGIKAAGSNDGVTLSGGVLTATSPSTWDALFTATSGTTSFIELAGVNVTLPRSITGSGTVSISDSLGNGSIIFNPGSGSQTISAALGGQAILTKTGAGILTLAGANTIGGAIAHTAGTLNIASIYLGSVTSSDGTTLDGEGIIGNLDVPGPAGTTLRVDPTTPGQLTVGGNVNANGPVSITFAKGPSLGGAPINVMSYGGALTGATNFALANASQYRTGTTVSASGGLVTAVIENRALLWNGTSGGEWQVGTVNRWNASESDSFYWGDHATFDDTGISTAITLTGELQPGAWVVNASSKNYTFTGSAGNFISGPTTLVKDGSSTLTVNAPNTYFGGTILSEGTIEIQSAGSLGNGPVVLGDANTGSANIALYLKPVDNANGSRINFGREVIISSAALGTVTIGSLLTTGGTGDNHQFTSIVLQRDVILDSNANDRTDYENISGTGNVTITGTGRSIFSTVNTFTGNLTVLGTLQLGTNSAAFNAIPDTTAVTVDSAGILNLSFTANGTETIGALNGNGTVGNNGGNANTLIVGGAATDGDFSGLIRNGAATTFGFTKTGGNTQVLSNPANTYTGVTTVTGGVLSIGTIANGGVASAIGQSAKAGTNLVLNGGVLRYTGTSVATDRAFQTGANGGGIEITDPAAILTFGSASTPFTLAGTLTKSGPGTLRFVSYGGSSAGAASDLVINEGAVEFGTGFFNASPFGFRALSITVNPGGILRTTAAHGLGGDNADAGTSWGQVRLLGGQFTVNGSQYISGGTVGGEGRLVLEGGTVNGSADLRAVNGGSTITVLPSAVTSAISNNGGISLQYGQLTFDVADGAAETDLRVTNAMSNANGITKRGLGLLELTGTNTYTGLTAVQDGTLLVTGSISGSAVNVTGGVLDGIGSTGAVTLNGGTLTAGGSAIESLNTATLLFNDGTLLFDLDASGTSDQLLATGSVAFGGAVELALRFTSDLPELLTFTLVSNDDIDALGFGSNQGLYLGSSELTPGFEFAYTSNGFTEYFAVNYAGGDGNDLTLTVVPEPGSAALLLAGLGLTFARRRRHQRA